MKFTMIPTARQQPTAANFSEMKIIGDVIMTVRFTHNDRTLDCKNIRFSVFEQLTVPALLGIEVLDKIELKLAHNRIILNDLHVPTIECISYKLNLNVMDAVTVNVGENLVTVVSMRSENIAPTNHPSLAEGDYLLTLDLLEGEICTSSPYMGINSFDTCLVNSSELQRGFHYHFNYEVHQLPATIPVILERVDRIPCKRVEETHLQKNILSAIGRKLINDETIQKLVTPTDFDQEGQKMLLKLIEKHAYVFSVDEEDIGKYTEEIIKLELKDPNDPPSYIKPRRIAYSLRGWLDEKLKNMVNKGIISESEGSPYNSPIHLVRKKNGSYRITIDLRNLNSKLKDNKYPLPNLMDLLERLQGSEYFSSIDFRSGFFNLVLDEASRPLTAFSANQKQFHMNRLPQGCKISPAAFQRIMQKIAGNMLKDSCLVYLDDLLVFSKSQEDHIKALENVFIRFGKAGLLLNPDKCIFGKKELHYVGYTINKDGWRPRSSNVEAIKNFSTPTDKKQARSFVGLCAFYSNAVPSLQYVLGPIHEITGCKSEFKWTESQQQAFDEAKDLLINHAVLSFPSVDEKHILYLTSDASDLGWGVTLSQVLDDAIERPLGFSSGRFRGSQLNWPIKEKELFAFVKGLEIFHVHLYLRPFRWRTDNRSLSYLTSESVVKKEPKRLNQKVLRWLDFINTYNFAIEHNSGTQPCMQPADALSRQYTPELQTISEKTFKKPFWTRNLVTMNEILAAQELDGNLQQNSAEWKNFQSRKWKRIVQNDIIYYEKRGKRVLAIPENLQNKLIEFHHLPMHVGITKLHKKLAEKYMMPKMFVKVRDYIKDCEICASFKKQNKPKIVPTPTSVGIHPFAYVQADLQGPLSKTLQGNQYILVVICLLTRWTEIRAIPDKSAKSVAHAMMEIFLCRGPPLSVQTDNGKEFKNQELEELLKANGIRLQHGCPYRPQSQGVVERANQKISKAFKVLQSENITWDEDLSSIQLSINLEHHVALGMSPWQAIHGWVLLRPCFIPTTFDYEKSLQSFDGALWGKTLTVKMHHAIADLYNKQASAKDTQISEPIASLPVGTRCLVYHEQPKEQCGKLYQHWKGFFRIKRQIDVYTYVVSPENAPRKEAIVHRTRLRILASDGTDNNANKATLKEGTFLGSGVGPADDSALGEDELGSFGQFNPQQKSPGVVGQEEFPDVRRSGRTQKKSYHKFF